MLKTASQTKGLYVIKTDKRAERIAENKRYEKARSLAEYESMLPWKHRAKLILMRAGLRAGMWSPITGFRISIR